MFDGRMKNRSFGGARQTFLALFFGTVDATKKTFVFVGVIPNAAIGAFSQKVILAERMGFDARATVNINFFEREITFVGENRKRCAQIPITYVTSERKESATMRTLHAARFRADGATTVATMQIGHFYTGNQRQN